MKLLVMGGGDCAAQTALYFYNLGADISLFSDTLSLSDNWKERELKTLRSLHKPFEVHRVQKRFLEKGRTVGERSRVIDLFRVVYFQKPTLENLQGELSDEDKKNLLRPLENYEDFDLVIDAREDRYVEKKVYAANEGLVGKEQVIYGEGELYGKEIALYGTSELISKKLSENINFLMKEEFEKLFLITFDQTLDLYGEMETFFQKEKELFEKKIVEFEQKMLEWKSLESYIQAKIPKPLEPKKRVFVLTNSKISNFEKVKESENLFMGVETIDLEKGEEFFQVIGAGTLFIKLGKSFNISIYHDLRVEADNGSFEDGLYFLGEENISGHLIEIENNMKRFFKRVGA